MGISSKAVAYSSGNDNEEGDSGLGELKVFTYGRGAGCNFTALPGPMSLPLVVR